MVRLTCLWLAAAAGSAIAACGGGAATSPANATAATQNAAPAAVPVDAARLSAADRAAIMQAAGYRLTRGEWQQSCGDPESAYAGEITRVSDMNGDGRPEVVVEGGNLACFGMVASGFTLVTLTPAGWRPIFQGSGIPSFYPRSGIAFPDLEIGGPGTNCFPFMRWNGREYALGGTSVGGRICDLRVMSAAMPLPVGYYVQEPAGCHELSASNPAMIGYLGRDRFVQVTSGRFVSFRRAGPGRYVQNEVFPSEDGGPGDPSTMEFTVDSESSFRLYDREGWSFCPLDRVPRAARFVDNPLYRNDPRIRPLRGR